MKRTNKKKIKHLIYSSSPIDFSDDVIHNILNSSQVNNNNNNITGALIYRLDLYLQFLEGPEKELDEVYGKIKNDTRHSNIFKLREDITERRLFASWAMRGDPARTWMWSHDDIANGLLRKLSPLEALNIFTKISREIDQFN